MKAKAILLCLCPLIFLSGCNQHLTDKKQSITYLCNYFEIIKPVADAMKVFEKDAMGPANYLKDHINELPISKRVEVINQIIQADDAYLVKLNTAVKELEQMKPIDDPIKLGSKTHMIFWLSQDFLSNDFKRICILFRDSLENLPPDYFDKLGYFNKQRDISKELIRLNNSIGDMQADFYKLHNFTDEDINELNKNCAAYK